MQSLDKEKLNDVGVATQIRVLLQQGYIQGIPADSTDKQLTIGVLRNSSIDYNLTDAGKKYRDALKDLKSFVGTVQIARQESEKTAKLIKEDLRRVREDISKAKETAKKETLDATDKAIKELEGKVRNVYLRIVEIMGVFVALFSFVILSAEVALQFKPQSIWDVGYVVLILFVVAIIIVIMLKALNKFVINSGSMNEQSAREKEVESRISKHYTAGWGIIGLGSTLAAIGIGFIVLTEDLKFYYVVAYVVVSIAIMSFGGYLVKKNA